jgi:hypothetical protein
MDGGWRTRRMRTAAVAMAALAGSPGQEQHGTQGQRIQQPSQRAACGVIAISVV